MTSDSKKPPKSRGSGAGNRATPKGRPAISREAYPTLTDPAELEAARKRSLELLSGDTTPPKKHPSSPLGLVNVNAPSEFPTGFGAPPLPKGGDELEAFDWDMAEPLHGEAGPPTLRVEVPEYKDATAEAGGAIPKPHAAGANRRSSGRTKVAQALVETPTMPAAARKSIEMDAQLEPEREMRERYSLGDYSGALEIAERVLESNPGHAGATELAESCRGTLEKMYTARIGPLDRVPMVMVPREQLRWLSIDHRAGFVLSHIDGVSSLDMILDVSGMPTLDALRILCELAQQRIISFR